MRRREFIAVVGGAAAAWPFAARAQQPAISQIGFGQQSSARRNLRALLATFVKALGEAGFGGRSESGDRVSLGGRSL